MIKNSMLKNGLILAAFAIVTTALISLTFSGTEDTIISQQQKKLQGILTAIVPEALYNNDMRQDCIPVVSPELLGSTESQTLYRATLDGKLSALALETIAPDGYSGRIKLVVGMDSQAKVTGVRVLEHKETPGLGDKIDIRISDWIRSFEDQVLTEQNTHLWAVRKDGGQFDQFTGATITPRAVVKGVKNALLFAQQNQQQIASAENTCRAQPIETVSEE